MIRHPLPSLYVLCDELNSKGTRWIQKGIITVLPKPGASMNYLRRPGRASRRPRDRPALVLVENPGGEGPAWDPVVTSKGR